MSAGAEPRCPSCQAPLLPGDRFCEHCGARMAQTEGDESACAVCGAPQSIDPDGYCSVCGARERSLEPRVELDLASAAAVSDRGRVHDRNEDAFHLEVAGPGLAAAVVCDGISSASAADTAARSAASAAGAVLAAALADRGGDGAAITRAAVGAAHEAVERVPWTRRADRAVPSCTLVCALWRNGTIAIGSVGDSRAYWIDSSGSRQLTTDDSWAEEQVAEGLLTAEEALRDRRAHSITNWIGPDAPEREPRLHTLHPPGPGRVLLCSDGLWNYAADAAALTDLVAALPDGASAAALARVLTDAAVERGGRDNITVVVIDIEPRGGDQR